MIPRISTDKTYLNRNGDKIKIVHELTIPVELWIDEFGNSYFANGHYWHLIECWRDLITEINTAEEGH